VLIGLIAIAGCSSDPSTIITSEKGLTRVVTLDATTHALLFTAADPIVPTVQGTTITAENAAIAAAAAAPNQFHPASCVATAVSAATVTYRLNDCATPLGVTGVTGNYSATYLSTPTALQITIASAGLQVQGIPVVVNATALYTQNGQARSLAVASRGSAPGDDYLIQQSLNTTLSWTQGQTCGTQTTSGTLTVNGVGFAQSMANLTRCTGQCPTASNFTIANGTATLVTVTFDGSTAAKITGTKSGNVVLACTPAQ
jgi:hypothetical protein